MRSVAALMLVLIVLSSLLAGCKEQKKEEPVTQAPTQPVPPPFPEAQVPAPEPQPQATVASPPPPAPPVDTSAADHQSAPTASRKPLPKDNYAPAETKAPRTYVVKKGDTLQKISKQFYGTTRKWRAIYEANRDVLKGGPDDLTVGAKLKIP